jgi:hypothetical protein
MSESANNRLQVLVALGGFGLGLITIYVPTWLFLRRISGLGRDDFLALHPEKRWLIIAYEIIAFLNVLTAPVVSIFLPLSVTPWMQPFMLYCYWSNSIGIVNGIFECITGICPKHGISLRSSYRECYCYHPGVRKIGLLRIVIGLFFVGASLILFRNGSL